MGQIAETSTFDATVYQWETTDSVTGGPNGIANAPLKNLANRTKFLKDRQDLLVAQVLTLAPTNSPALTGSPTAPTPAMSAKSTELATAALARAFSSGLIGIAMTPTYSLSPVEAGFATLLLSGGLQNPALLLLPTNIVGKWTILNGTNVAVSVRLSQGGQAISIAAGTAQTIIANGTDCFNAHNDYTSIFLGGSPGTPAPALDDNSSRVTNTAWVNAKIAQEAATRSAADTQIRNDVGASYALQSALNAEASARAGGDSQEAQARAQADATETAARIAADNQIRTDVDATYLRKGRALGGNVHSNFTPGDFFDVPVRMTFQAPADTGGLLFFTASLIMTNQVPNAATLRQFIGSQQVNSETTYGTMPVQFCMYVAAGFSANLDVHLITSGGGGWCQMALGASYVFVPSS